jgi:hypothetical protein
MARPHSLDQSSLDVAEGVVSRDLHLIGNQREGGENVGELLFGQAVEMRDEAVEFGAEFRALGGDGRPDACGVRLPAEDFLRQIVELRRRADQPRRPLYNRPNAASFSVRRGTGSW